MEGVRLKWFELHDNQQIVMCETETLFYDMCGEEMFRLPFKTTIAQARAVKEIADKAHWYGFHTGLDRKVQEIRRALDL